jgi:hypothetical protein
MVKVNFNTSDFRRQVADEEALVLRNRYFEENPFLNEGGSALIARPGMKRLTSLGDGPVRGLASEAGSFGGDLFVASGSALYRMTSALASTLLFTGLDNPVQGFVNMAITGSIGTAPEYCFVCDGGTLYVYIANGYAINVLTGTPANNDTVTLASVVYKFTTGSVNAGTPAGTGANPWLVALGANSLAAFTNLANAINASGVAGTDYSTVLTQHTTVQSTGYTSTLMPVRSKLIGALGNATASTETGAALSWTLGATLSGGGAGTFQQVYLPDDIGAIDVSVINSYVIVVPVQSTGYTGRFYWIEPGEVIINPLNFATAERSPDGIYGVQVFGDQFWLPGESTTEVWYVTGDAVNPMRRLQGIVLDRGSWANTSKAVHETMVMVDADGGVFTVQGGRPERVSTPDIEEQIRRAISTQNALT